MIAIIALLQALASLAPQVPEIIRATETAVGLLQTGETPTDEHHAIINAGVAAVQWHLQGS